MVRAAPQLARLQAWRSVHSMFARHIKDEHLRQAFSFHTLLVRGNPFSTSSIYALIHALERQGGVWFAKGGTGALVAGMVQLFWELGGTIHLNAPVERIGTEGARATAIHANRQRHPFDMVASNADVVHTYRKLLGDPKSDKLAAKRHSMSLFVVYFGLHGLRPDLRHHMVLFGPRYRELVNQIFAGTSLADDFSLYLHAPSVTDPDLAPEGCSTYYVLAPVPHLGTVAPDWEKTAPIYRDRLLDYLEARYIPNLRRDLMTVRHFSPVDFRSELNAHRGSAFSIEPILTQSAWFRPHNRDDRLKNLYIVGAGTHPGAGIPGVVGSAEATASLMLGDAR